MKRLPQRLFCTGRGTFSLGKLRRRAGNAIRAHLVEFGIVTAKGAKRVADLTDKLEDLPEAARLPLQALIDQLAETQARIDRLTEEIKEVHRQSEVSRRLTSIPCAGAYSKTFRPGADYHHHFSRGERYRCASSTCNLGKQPSHR